MVGRVSRWEKLQRDHIFKVGEEAINDVSKRSILINMLPKMLADHIKKELMWKPPAERTYKRIKEVTMSYAHENAPIKDPDAMDCDYFDDEEWEEPEEGAEG